MGLFEHKNACAQESEVKRYGLCNRRDKTEMGFYFLIPVKFEFPHKIVVSDDHEHDRSQKNIRIHGKDWGAKLLEVVGAISGHYNADGVKDHKEGVDDLHLLLKHGLAYKYFP